MSTAIKIENLSKAYRLGVIGSGTLRDDVQRWWAKFRKRENPLLKVNASHNGNRNGDLVYALQDVNLDIAQGEILGIIGKNGAGKSTLLKIISRITAPTTGVIKYNGRVAALLEVGTGFHPELTGRENIYLNGAILGMTKREITRKFDEILAFSEIEKFIDTPVKRYSSGMKVRLGFAVAAHLEPEILIVDEVLAVGDVSFQKKCLGKMDSVVKQGRTVLFVSHNLTAIRTLCKRAILLEDGKLVHDGDTESVLHRYVQDIESRCYLREWHDDATAPQNLTTIIKKIAITGNRGKLLDKIYTDTSFNIEIDYKIKRNHSQTGLTIVFYDKNNNCVFSSINNLEKKYYGKPMPKGTYKSTCKIPSNLLNNDLFSLSVFLFGANFTDFEKVNDVLRIEILDGHSIRGDYFGKFGGYFRPSLQWSTTAFDK